MEGYGNQTYGDSFADVYDDWYLGISDIDATVRELVELAGDGPVLELGVGTGRLAVPLADAGVTNDLFVTGIDSSAAMLEKLSENDHRGLVHTIHGDMVDDLPTGPFGLVLIAYNTLFNLTAGGQQQACFVAVADRLTIGGKLIIEAFVPDESITAADDVSVRSLTTDRVVLSISRNDPSDQYSEGQFVEFTESGGVRLRPWAIRYSTPEQLDSMAEAAGLSLEHRWEAFGRVPFDDNSIRHVSVYQRRPYTGAE